MAKEYVVKSGDSLSAIARDYKTDVATLTQLNSIQDPNRISVGQVIVLPGNDYGTAIDSAKKELETGVTWGTAWWNVKNAVPDADNMQIDKDLNKTFWAQPGAYEKFSADKSQPFSLDLDTDTGIKTTTPAFIPPKAPEVKGPEPGVQIVDPFKAEEEVKVVELPTPKDVEIVTPDFKQPEVTFVTPEGRPYTPRQGPTKPPAPEADRSFFSEISSGFRDKIRKFGDNINQIYKVENMDVFEEVRDSIAEDVSNFFTPMSNAMAPSFNMFDTFRDGTFIEGLTKQFVTNAARTADGEAIEGSLINLFRKSKEKLDENKKINESFDYIREGIQKSIVEGKPIEGALSYFAGFRGLTGEAEKAIDRIDEEPEHGTEVAAYKLKTKKAGSGQYNSIVKMNELARELAELGVPMNIQDGRLPEFSGDQVDMTKAVERIYEGRAEPEIEIIKKNNEYVSTKTVEMGNIMNQFTSITKRLGELNYKDSAPEIHRQIQEVIGDLAERVQVFTDIDASVNQLNQYNSTYEEAVTDANAIVDYLEKKDLEYNSYMDAEMSEYINSSDRIQTMNQVELQAYDNYGYMNRERINKMNIIAEEIESAKERLDIVNLQANKAGERFNDLKATIEKAENGLIGKINTTNFKNTLTKYNLMAADQADALVQSMTKYKEADTWLRENNKKVIDANLKLSDEDLIAQAEIAALDSKVSSIMDRMNVELENYNTATAEMAEAMQFEKIAALGHASDVAEAVEGKRYLLGIFPAFGNIMPGGKPISTNKEVMEKAFGPDYTKSDTQEVYFEYLKSRAGALLMGVPLKLLGWGYNVIAAPAYSVKALLPGQKWVKPSSDAIEKLYSSYNWLYGKAIPSLLATTVQLKSDLDFIGIPTDTPAGHLLANIGLPDEYKNGLTNLPKDEDPAYGATRAGRSLMAWLNMPGPEDQQLLWTKWDKRETEVGEVWDDDLQKYQNGSISDFVDPWDIDARTGEVYEKRLKQLKKLNPSIKNWNSMTPGTTILLYEGNENATEWMRKQDALYNFLAGRFSEERIVADKETDIYKMVPRSERYGDEVSAILDLNDFKTRGIDPEHIPEGTVIRFPTAFKIPSLSNMIDPENRIEFKAKHPILSQIREEAIDIVFDPVDLLWYPAAKAVKPLLKAINMKAYSGIARRAERNAFHAGVKNSVDLAYSIGAVLIKGKAPDSKYYKLPTQLLDEAKGKSKITLRDLLTNLDMKNKTSLATLTALSTKLRGISLAKTFPYEIRQQISMTDKDLNRIRAENEILFIESLQKVSQQTGMPTQRVKTYIHEYIANPVDAGRRAESIFWKFNEHMGLSEGRLVDLMNKYPDSYYDHVVTTKVSNIKDLVSKDIANNADDLLAVLEINDFDSMGIDPAKIPAGVDVVTSPNNFFKEFEKEIFRSQNMTRFETIYIAERVSKLDEVGRQALIDMFQYWDPKKNVGRPIYNRADLAKRVSYWRNKFAKDAPEQKSITQALEVADIYRSRTEHWAKMVEEKYAVPVRMSEDMELYGVSPEKFQKLSKEERDVWGKNGILYYTDPDTGKMKVMAIMDTKNGLSGDLLRVETKLKAMKMQNLSNIVVGTMEDLRPHKLPKDYSFEYYKDKKTGDDRGRIVYTKGGKKDTVIVWTSVNQKSGRLVIGDVTAKDLLHTAYMNPNIGGGGKGWVHTLSKKQQFELGTIISKVQDRSTGLKKIEPTISEERFWYDAIEDTYGAVEKTGKKVKDEFTGEMVDEYRAKGYQPYVEHKGSGVEYYEERPDIDLVLQIATGLEDLYSSNKNFYDSLKGILQRIRSNVEKKTVRYKMDPVDELVLWLMEMHEGKPNFFSRPEHHIIELMLRGHDITDMNILELLNQQQELGKAWARSKRAKKIANTQASLLEPEKAASVKLRVNFNMRENLDAGEKSVILTEVMVEKGMLVTKENIISLDKPSVTTVIKSKKKIVKGDKPAPYEIKNYQEVIARLNDISITAPEKGVREFMEKIVKKFKLDDKLNGKLAVRADRAEVTSMLDSVNEFSKSGITIYDMTTKTRAQFAALKEKLKMVPGMISKREGGIGAKGRMTKFTDDEAAEMFARYGDAAYMMAHRRLNREFSHLFSGRIPDDLMPKYFNKFTEQLTGDAMQAMAKISKMEGAEAAIIPLKLSESIKSLQGSRRFIELNPGDVKKTQGGKDLPALTAEEFVTPEGEAFIPLETRSIDQKSLDKLNGFEKKAAQAKVDMTFAKNKLNAARAKKASVTTINKLNDAYKDKLEVFKELTREGNDYVTTLGDPGVKYIDRAPGGFRVKTGRHEAIEYSITPEVENILTSVKLEFIDGKPNPMYRRRFLLPMDSAEHRLLYEYLKTRSDFTEGIHYMPVDPILKDVMTSTEILELLGKNEMQPLIFMLTKRLVHSDYDGHLYSPNHDDIVKLVNESLNPGTFSDPKTRKLHTDQLKERLAQMRMSRWDPVKKELIVPKKGEYSPTALEAARADIAAKFRKDEMAGMTTTDLSQKQIAAKVEEARSGPSRKKETEGGFTGDGSESYITQEQLNKFNAGDNNAMEEVLDEALPEILDLWNEIFYGLKKELGIADLKPVKDTSGLPVVPGSQRWELVTPPTGKLKDNIAMRMMSMTDGHMLRPELLSKTVKEELARRRSLYKKDKEKYFDFEWQPDKFAADIGRVFEMQDKIGPEDLGRWIKEESKLIEYEKHINPLEREIEALRLETKSLNYNGQRKINAAQLKLDKTKHAAKKLLDKAEDQTKKLGTADAKKIEKEFVEPALSELAEAELKFNKEVDKIQADTAARRQEIIDTVNDKMNELAMYKMRRDGDHSVTRDLLRGDGPNGTLFDSNTGRSFMFIKETYARIEKAIAEYKNDIAIMKAELREPGKYLADPERPVKPTKTDSGYIFEPEKGKARKDIGPQNKLIRLSNAERELARLEAYRDMIIPWNLAKANGINFAEDELYWMGKQSIMDSVGKKLDDIGHMMAKRRKEFEKNPYALEKINIPVVVSPKAFAPEITELDIRKAFYDKLEGVTKASQVTLFKTDIIEVGKVTNIDEVLNSMRDLLRKTKSEKNFPYVYDMSGKLRKTLKAHQNNISNAIKRTKDPVLRKEIFKNLDEIDRMLKDITIIVDDNFLADTLKTITPGTGMAADISEYKAIVTMIDKMKERGSVWLFGESTHNVTPSKLKDSLYGKGMTDKSRARLRVMRESYARLAKESQEPLPGFPHHFAKNPESLTTRVLGSKETKEITPESLDLSIKPISQNAFKDAANANLQKKAVDYDVGIRKVKSYNQEIKGKHVLVRSEKGTMLSTDFKRAIINGIDNDVTFYFPSFMHDGEKSIHSFIKQFKGAKIKFTDARDSNIAKILKQTGEKKKPLPPELATKEAIIDPPTTQDLFPGALTLTDAGKKLEALPEIDYLLTNQQSFSTKGMQKMYDDWGYDKQGRLLVSPQRLKDNYRAEITRDFRKYIGDPDKFPPIHTMEKAARSAKVFNKYYLDTKSIVIDWASAKKRRIVKQNWADNIEELSKRYRKEMMDNLESRYPDGQIPEWHRKIVEEQVKRVNISLRNIEDHVFKFDMPLRTWEVWYKNVSRKLFYYNELANKDTGLTDELNYGANVVFESYPARLQMYKALEAVMRWAPVAPNILMGVGRGLKQVWIWAILLLKPGWMVWNSLSDGVRAAIGARNIRAFIDMQRMFIENSLEMVGEFGKNIYHGAGDLTAIDIIAKKGIKRADGSSTAAKLVSIPGKADKIYFDRVKLTDDFNDRVWTKPTTKGVNSMKPDTFKTIDEYENYVLHRERMIIDDKPRPKEAIAEYINRINAQARKMKDKARYQVYDLNKVAAMKKSILHPVGGTRYRKAWAARNERKMTDAGEIIDFQDWDDITSSGLAQYLSDPDKSAAHVKILREDGIKERLLKRAWVFRGDVEIFNSMMEEGRRQIMAFDLIYRKAFTKAEANAKVKKWMFDYRDLTLVGQKFRTFFPFYSFTKKSLELWLGTIVKYGPGAYNAAAGLLEAWQDVTSELPDQYKDRVQVGNRWYWLTRFGILEYLKVIIDPIQSVKEFVDNPMKVAFNFGWGPLSSFVIERWQNKGFYETGPLLRDFGATGWYQEEIDRFKANDDYKFYDDVSYSKEHDAVMTFFLTFVPPAEIVKLMFEMDVGFTLRGGSILQSKAARALVNHFTGVNILSMDSIAYVYDRINELPPHYHYFFKKSLEASDPELYNYFRQYSILSKMKKIMDSKDGSSKEEKIIELHEAMTIDTYYEMEFQEDGSGDAWLEQNPQYKPILEKHFDGITAKYGETSGMILGKEKFGLNQIDAGLRQLFSTVKDVDQLKINKMNAIGIEHPFSKPFDKQELKDALYREDGTAKFRTPEEAYLILEQYDAILTLLDFDEYKAGAEKTYHDWQLLSDQAKKDKREGDNKYYQRMAMIFSVIPDNIETLSEAEAQVYWNKWRKLKEALIDSVPEYSARYEKDVPAWQREYLEKNEQYLSIWANIRAEDEGDENFFDKFYGQEPWFQQWYFLKHPKKALYFPIVSDYSDRVQELVKQREETGSWDSVGFSEALNRLWSKQNALKAWDEAKPGVYNYIEKHRQVWDKMAEKQLTNDDTIQYFDLFYQNEGDKDWDAYREYYLNKEDNQYKKITYPFMRTWTSLIAKDDKNDTKFAPEWFWSPNHAEARRLYGEHNPLEDGKNKLDYQTRWRDFSPQMEEDSSQVYKFVLDSPSWFKNEYWRNHPDREIYYPLALDLLKYELPEEHRERLEAFFLPGNKSTIEAWERDKPGTIAYNRFRLDLYEKIDEVGRAKALDWYFEPANEIGRIEHEKRSPGVLDAYRLWQDYAKIGSSTWSNRKAQRTFLKDNPKLQEWWNRFEEDDFEAKQVRIKEQTYYAILDRVSAEGKGRQYYLDYYKAKAEAAKYLKDNPDLAKARDIRFNQQDAEDTILQKLVNEYYALTLQEDKTEFLEKHPDVNAYIQDLVPPGIKKVRKLQDEYFDIIYDDEDKQLEARQKFLADHPELVEYWDVKNLPSSYFTDKAEFEKTQTVFNKANDYFDAVKSGDWQSAEKMVGKFTEHIPDLRTEEGRWLLNKLYREAMATWATTFGTYMSTYYFRSLPSWLRNEYYRRHPEAKIISYTPMSRSLNNAVTISDSSHPDLNWARAMMKKYGKDLPSSIDKQVQIIMIKWREWGDRSTWSSKQWSEWQEARTARLNGLRAHDLQYLPLLQKELARANKMFSYSMLPIRGSRKYGIINPFLGSSVLLPELTVGLDNDIINNN